jgi:phospholipid transport system transporter-binding protein
MFIMFDAPRSLTVENATSALEAGLRAIAAGQTSVDFAQTTVVDSAAVATLLAWQRAADTRGVQLQFVNLPANLQILAKLYGVSELLVSCEQSAVASHS